MNIYNSELVKNPKNFSFAFLEVVESDHVLTVTFDRADKKNALHPHMLNEVAFAMQYAHESKDIWVVVVQAKGDVFCAGADLKAMAGFVSAHDSTVPAPESDVLFDDIFSGLHKPLIMKVEGHVYAGGFLFLSGATHVVAVDDIRLALTEVKRGIYPMQVMASLLQVMSARKVIDWCIGGYALPVQKAAEYGLVTTVCSRDVIDSEVQRIIDQLKQNSPTAIRLGLEAYNHIKGSQSQHLYLREMLGKAITSKDGQEGLAAFREKRKPNWTGE